MKVFISSTYTDLVEYRQQAVKAILAVGMQPIVTEEITAGEEIAEAIKSAINAADIFLIILGFRIGAYSDKDFTKTWLEKEYEIAIMNKKPVLAFMLSDNVPVRAADIDRDFDKVKAFRQQVLSKYLVKFVDSPSSLYADILLALSKVRGNAAIANKGFDNKRNSSQEINSKTSDAEYKEVRILRLLLSSPGDVSAERDSVAKAVFRFNQEYTIERGIFIKLIRWEDFAPQIGGGPQKVVNNQLGSFDIFIGLMWNRFGTPTDLASSGTEEEFNDALASWQKNNKPWITFYFCERPSNFITSEQLEQKAKVLLFKQKLFSLGLVKTYEYLEVFENMVFSDLVKITELYLKK